MTKKYELSGIDCAVCAKKTEDAINRIDGVHAKFVYVTETLTITADDSIFNEKLLEVKKVIKKTEPGSSVKAI